MPRSLHSFEGGSSSQSSRPEGGERSPSERSDSRRSSHADALGSRHHHNAEQRSQWEIKRIELKNVKSCQTKVKDFIREMSCGIIKESRSNIIEANIMIEDFNSNIRANLQENLNYIPDEIEIKNLFKNKIDILVEKLEKAYGESLHDYGRLSLDFERNKWSKIRRKMGKEHMKECLNMFKEEEENIREAQEILQPFQEAREKYKEALNYVWQGCKPSLREIADRKIDSAMKRYGRVVLQEDQQGSDLVRARKDIGETTEWLEKETRRLKKVVENQINWQIEEIEEAFWQYGQPPKLFEEGLAQCQRYSSDPKCKPLDEWRQVFEKIHGQVIDELPISTEDKKRLKAFQKFKLFYDSIDEISNYEMAGMRDLLKLKKIYSEKINKLWNNSNNRYVEYLIKHLPWNNERGKNIDAMHKELEERVNGIWQSLLKKRTTVVGQSLDSSAQN